MKAPLLLISLLLGCSSLSLWADSPLTSTPFHKAYLYEPAVKQAAQTHYLNGELLDVLLDDGTAIQVKFALVNALGWSFDQELGNSLIYLEALAEQKGIEPKKFREHLDKFSSEELTLLGYMSALEKYLEDKVLISIAEVLEKAVEKHRESYCANLALTLVKAQVMMSEVEQWKKVWEVYVDLENKAGLQRKLDPDAVEIIRDYLVLYKEG